MSIVIGVLIPATTSSPCAFIRNSPYILFSPVAGFLENATPVPQSSPIFPNTIIWIFTAVPQSPGISFNLLYLIALGLFQDLNTASIHSNSKAFTSCGNAEPVWL